jgi:hypothetical protein
MDARGYGFNVQQQVSFYLCGNQFNDAVECFRESDEVVSTEIALLSDEYPYFESEPQAEYSFESQWQLWNDYLN